MATPDDLQVAETHVRILGILNLVFAALGLLGAAVLLLLARGLQQFADAGGYEFDAAGRALLTGLAAFAAAAALLELAVGIGLLQRQAWARVPAYITGALSLLNVPVGTAFGAYTFYALSRPGIEEVLQDPTQETGPAKG